MARSTLLDGRRVLLIEDEAMVAFFLQDVLEEQGCVVLGPATSLAQALEAVELEPPPDLAVVDVNLRGEMSWPAVEALERRGVPIVIASGYAGLEPEREIKAAAVLAKPVSPERLIDAVLRALAGVGARPVE